MVMHLSGNKGVTGSNLGKAKWKLCCFYFANGDFKGKWERLTEAMGISKAKGGGAAFHS